MIDWGLQWITSVTWTGMIWLMVLSSHIVPSAPGALSATPPGKKGLLALFWGDLTRTTGQERPFSIGLTIIPMLAVMMISFETETNSKSPTLFDLRKEAGKPNGPATMTVRSCIVWVGTTLTMSQVLETTDSEGTAQTPGSWTLSSGS